MRKSSNVKLVEKDTLRPQIGDFVNYKLQELTDEEIQKLIRDGHIKDEKSLKEIPTKEYTFGNFELFKENQINCDTLNAKDMTGWRIWDINDNGIITLISAGTVEEYYHSYKEEITQYIFTGKYTNVYFHRHLPAEIVQRSFSMYENMFAIKKSARFQTKEEIDKLYQNIFSLNDTEKHDNFREIYGSKYQNIIDIDKSYWLDWTNESGYLYTVYPESMCLAASYCNSFGIRVLVSLQKSTKFSFDREITVINSQKEFIESNQFKYNVWNLSK